MNKASLECRHISLSYGSTPVLRDINLKIEPGEFFALLGPSGSGKSTLLRLIAGFNQHQRGELLVDGQDISGVPPHLRQIGMVFQNYALWPHMTVWDNVAFGLVERRESRDAIRRKVGAALDLVGLGDYGRELLVGSPWLVVVTLIGGTFALLALASVVTRHGLGSGVMVVLLGGGLVELHAVARNLRHAGSARLTLTLAAVAALALATTWLLARRTTVQPQRRLPGSSLDALVLPQLVLALLSRAVLVGGVAPARVLEWLQPARVEVLVVFALVAATIAVGLGRAYTGRLDAAPVDVTFLTLVLVVGYVLGKLAGLPALSIVIGTGWLLDVQAEWCARLPDPVDVAELDDPQRGDLVLGTLAAAGIPAHLRGVSVRTLLRFFAPFVPITVRVPRAQAAEAQELLARLPA